MSTRYMIVLNCSVAPTIIGNRKETISNALLVVHPSQSEKKRGEFYSISLTTIFPNQMVGNLSRSVPADADRMLEYHADVALLSKPFYDGQIQTFYFIWSTQKRIAYAVQCS